MKMLRDFKLKIDNFGPINQADLNISKINIIAGKNASGKTSISKLLYCIITAFSTDGDYLSYESMKEQFNLLISNLQIPYEESEKHIDEVLLDPSEEDLDYTKDKGKKTKKIGKIRKAFRKIKEILKEHKNKIAVIAGVLVGAVGIGSVIGFSTNTNDKKLPFKL